MKEDVLRVLKMVEEGKIDSAKGSELIEALSGAKPEENQVVKANVINFNDERMLKVKVLSAKGDNVNVQLPVKLIKGVLAACGKLPINVHGVEGLDTEALFKTIESSLNSDLIGKIVDIKSGEGDIVEVVIE